MLKMAIIEDSLAELLQVVADVRAFDSNGSSVTILPLLVAPVSAEALQLETSRVVERLTEALAADKTVHFPDVDQSLGPLDLGKKEDRQRLLSYLASQRVDLILADCAMGHDQAGLELLSDAQMTGHWNQRYRACWLMTQFSDIYVLMQTANVDGNFDPYDRTIDKSLMTGNGTGECAQKLQAILESAIQRKKELRESETTNKFQKLIGKSPAMQDVYQKIGTYARSAFPILILGESGTGKELAADAIHVLSQRHELVTHNCAETPSTLIDGILFGRVKGAFTDARDSPGLIEMAHQGTLFLDEIGQLPLDSQAKLLRVLEDGEVRRVGALLTRKIDIRLISATNKDITRAPEDEFRKDLLHRINVAPITMPPLRTRKEDIPLLAEAFVSATPESHAVKSISPKAMDVLMKWNWPGNVRELENLIKAAATEAIKAGYSSINMDCPKVHELSGRISREVVPMAFAAAVEIAVGDQSVEQLWDSVREGRYRLTLAEWSRKIGVPKTIQLADLVARKYGDRIYPPEDVIMDFFTMKYNAYKNWIKNNRLNADSG